MRLTKAQRAALHAMFDGRCAYCGQPLGERWHADHVEALRRNDWCKVPGPPEHPERDRIENMMPACAPCNIDKHSMSLENWRDQMQRSHDTLHRDNGTYRRMKRFGMVVEQRQAIVFHFEHVAAEKEAS